MNKENRIIQTNSDKEKEVEEYELVLEKQNEQNKIERFKKSGVPERFWNESFNTFYPRNSDEEKKLEAAKKYSQVKTDIVLLFTGNVGTGKTHLGSAIIRNCGGKFISIEELIFKYESAQDFHAKTNREELMESYANTEMLVIDEIGRSMQQEKENALLNYILRRRYENMLPTVLISNLSKADLLKKLGEAVLDRLRETCISLEFEGESYRISIRDVNL